MEDSAKKETVRKFASRLTIIVLSLALFASLLYNFLGPGGAVPLPDSGPPLAGPGAGGEQVTVRVSADSVRDMYGYQFRLYYDQDVYRYNRISSSIDGIEWIFAKSFSGYLLAGATMVGDVDGHTEEGPVVCEIVLDVLADGPDAEVSLSAVNVVSSGLEYTEGVEGWSCAIVEMDAEEE